MGRGVGCLGGRGGGEQRPVKRVRGGERGAGGAGSEERGARVGERERGAWGEERGAWGEERGARSEERGAGGGERGAGGGERERAAAAVLGDVGLFSRVVLKRPLYGYQVGPARAIVASVLEGRGEDFLLVMARQSGKNELVGQVLVYLLNRLRREACQMVYAAIGDNVGRGVRRLEGLLDNGWNRYEWKRGGRPTRRSLGKASVVFLSSHRQAFARGETAHHLLVVDELQDQDGAHLQAVFEPMRAATNATAVYLGTTRTTYDALWRKKEALERLETADGVQRVFLVGPEAVMAENEAYARFLGRQVARLGRRHPLIASEYFLEPLDGESGFLGERRVGLMMGEHGRVRVPEMRAGDRTRTSADERGREVWGYVATLDVAGIEEAGTSLTGTYPLGAVGNGGRDYTVCTVFRVRSGGRDWDRDRDEIGVGIGNMPLPAQRSLPGQGMGGGLRRWMFLWTRGAGILWTWGVVRGRWRGGCWGFWRRGGWGMLWGMRRGWGKGW